jgi:hypothetical protein
MLFSSEISVDKMRLSSLENCSLFKENEDTARSNIGASGIGIVMSRSHSSNAKVFHNNNFVETDHKLKKSEVMH